MMIIVIILLFRLPVSMMFHLYWFILFFFIYLISSEKVCPSYGNTGHADRHSCFDQCSPDATDQCESNKKCCFFLTSPCGYRCIVPKDDQPKSGRCPSPDCKQIEILWSMCDIRLCDVDNDCPANQKCCSNRCNARMCLTPITSRRKRSWAF